MRRPSVWLLAVIAGLSGWLISQELFDGGNPRWRQGRQPSVNSSAFPLLGTPFRRPGATIHVATFNADAFGQTKASRPHVMDTLASIARQFDVLAIQEVRSEDQDILPRLVDHINAGGRTYDYVIGPRVGREPSLEQFAFLYDRSTVEIDRYELYTVQDPHDLMQREPLVGWFRAIGPPGDAAFTFSLVNVHIEPDAAQQELNVLDQVFRAVREDGRGEDDVIVLGDFSTDGRRLGPLAQLAGMARAITGIPTNTRGTTQYDNLMFQRQATDEFTGRGGVLDFMRQFNFTMEEAIEISDHLPVWAEFSVYEGGSPGRVAAKDASQK